MTDFGLPTTKQFREYLKTAFKEHGVSVESSRTREMSGYLAWRHFGVGSYKNYGPAGAYRRLVYKIHCQCEEDKQAITAAINDAKVIMALSGQDARIKLLFRKWTPFVDLEAIAVIA